MLTTVGTSVIKFLTHEYNIDSFCVLKFFAVGFAVIAGYNSKPEKSIKLRWV